MMFAETIPIRRAIEDLEKSIAKLHEQRTLLYRAVDGLLNAYDRGGLPRNCDELAFARELRRRIRHAPNGMID